MERFHFHLLMPKQHSLEWHNVYPCKNLFRRISTEHNHKLMCLSFRHRPRKRYLSIHWMLRWTGMERPTLHLSKWIQLEWYTLFALYQWTKMESYC